MENAKTEVLRYLGYRGQKIHEELSGMVEECMLLIRKAAKPRHVLGIFDISVQKVGVQLEDTAVLLQGADICCHLAGCGQAVLFAATLGIQADELIRRQETVDMTRVLVLDACATQLIEQSCDEIEEQLREDTEKQGLSITSRFSPGYGDLPLDVQPKLLSLLDANRRIGLTCTDSLILLPRKSVTAIIGIGKDLQAKPKNCGSCPQNGTCRFKKEKAND